VAVTTTPKPAREFGESFGKAVTVTDRRIATSALDSPEWQQHWGLARIGVIGVFTQFCA